MLPIIIDNLEQQKGSSEKALPILCTFQTVIVNFRGYPFGGLAGISRRKSYLDTVRQPQYW
jgi:hypothetical protein